jgi:UPF0176 protein
LYGRAFTAQKLRFFMQEAGVTNVYQLNEGILKYFNVGGYAHFEGACFVFDERRALNPALQPRVHVGAMPDNC